VYVNRGGLRSAPFHLENKMIDSENIKCPHCGEVGSILVEEVILKRSSFSINSDGYIEWGDVISEEGTMEGIRFFCTVCFEDSESEQLASQGGEK
jgi:hypothetical protein